MSASQDQQPTTITDVVAYAAELRDRAAKLTDPHSKQYDPWAKPYAPTEAAARKLVTRIRARAIGELPADATDEQRDQAAAEAPALALDELAYRAMRAERQVTEGRTADKRRHNRLANAHTRAGKQQVRHRTSMSPGQRIDTALALLGVIAAGPTAYLGEKVSGGDDHHGEAAPFPGDPTAEARRIAIKAARDIEAQVDRARYGRYAESRNAA